LDSVAVPCVSFEGAGFLASTTQSSLDLSGASVFCNSQFGTTSSIASDFGAAICTAVGFLFIPTSQSVTQFESVPANFQSRFPVSWFASVQTLLGSLQASSTANYPSYSYDLTSVASSSPYAGDILPGGTLGITNPTYIQNLAPDSAWVFIRTLIGYILWISFAYFVYHKVRQIFKQTL